MYLFCWRIFPVGGDVVIFDHPPGVGVETAAAAGRSVGSAAVDQLLFAEHPPLVTLLAKVVLDGRRGAVGVARTAAALVLDRRQAIALPQVQLDSKPNHQTTRPLFLCLGLRALNTAEVGLQ